MYILYISKLRDIKNTKFKPKMSSIFEIKEMLIAYARQYRLTVYTISDSNIIKIEHPLNCNVRLSITINSVDSFTFDKYINSQLTGFLFHRTRLGDVRGEILSFVVNDPIYDPIVELEEMYEDMRVNCENGI